MRNPGYRYQPSYSFWTTPVSRKSYDFIFVSPSFRLYLWLSVCLSVRKFISETAHYTFLIIRMMLLASNCQQLKKQEDF